MYDDADVNGRKRSAVFGKQHNFVLLWENGGKSNLYSAVFGKTMGNLFCIGRFPEKHSKTVFLFFQPFTSAQS